MSNIRRDARTGVRETEWQRNRRLERNSFAAASRRFINYNVREMTAAGKFRSRILPFKDDWSARQWGKQTETVVDIRRGKIGPVVFRSGLYHEPVPPAAGAV